MKKFYSNCIKKELLAQIIGGITDPDIEDDGDEYEDMANDLATPTGSSGTPVNTNPAPRRSR